MTAADKLLIYAAWALFFLALATLIHARLERARRHRTAAAHATRCDACHTPIRVTSADDLHHVLHALARYDLPYCPTHARGLLHLEHDLTRDAP